MSSLADIRAYAVLILVIAVGCSYEYTKMLETLNAKPFGIALYTATTAYIVLAAIGELERFESALVAGLVIYTAAAILVQSHNAKTPLSLSTVAPLPDERTVPSTSIVPRAGATIFGVLYIGKLLSYFVVVRGLPGGLQLSVILIFIIAFTDIFAMLVGRKFGKTPLTRISPGKTVEGAVGGAAAAIMGACGLVAVFLTTGWLAGAVRTAPIPASLGGLAPQLPNVHTMMPFGFGGADLSKMLPVLAATALVAVWTSIAAQSGDVVESALKRDAGVKDAGTVFAGHGGVFDRFDSYLGGGIAFYAAVMLFGYPGRG